MILYVIIFAALLVYFAFIVWLMQSLIAKDHVQPISTNTLQLSIGILIPARNEGVYIDACIKSVLQQYDNTICSIYVGNDGSTDNTAALVRRLSSQYQNIFILDIPASYASLLGKQKVLAYLVANTYEDLLLVVDADCIVTPTWISETVAHFATADIAMVSGPTVVDGSGLIGKLQSLDWCYGMGSFQALADRGLPVTAVGNNMAFRRSAYVAIGGYEALPSSLVEDFLLFQAFRRAGYGVAFPASPHNLNRSAAVSDLRTLLQQRRRWFRGASQTGAPLASMLPFIGQAVALLAIIASSVMSWQMSSPWPLLATFGMKAAVDAAFLWQVNQRLTPTESVPWAWVLPHQIYLLLAMLLLPLYLYWPGKTIWKGRKL